MHNHDNPAANRASSSTLIEAGEAGDAAEPAAPALAAGLPWHAQVGELLAQAAALCTAHGVDVDAYMSGAWAAYVEARPGMRAQLEEAQLAAQLDELRKLGRLGRA